MRLIDADELIEHAWRDKLDSRELIAEMIEKAPTIKEIPTNIPIDVFEKLISQKPRWIPLTKRPMTDEEIEHYFEYTDMRIDDTYTILDCSLPDDGQEVLISWGGNVGNDVFIQDNEGCYFEGVDIDEVDAWMPLPEPYKAESEST